MIKQLFLLFLLNLTACFGQQDDKEIYPSKIHYLTFGINSDINNSLFGLLVGNGVDEKPLYHFEDISNDCLYKVTGQTDLEKNYSYGATIGWNTPSRRLLFLTVTLLTIDYSQRQINNECFFQKKLNTSGEFYLKHLRFTLLGKLGFNEINNSMGYGGEIGFRKSFKYFYFGGTFGKYSDKNTFNVFSQINVYKKKLHIRFNYDKIEDFNSLNIGVNYIFRTSK